MPGRIKTAVTCLAISLAYCAGVTSVSAEDATASASGETSGKTVRTELEYLTSRQNLDRRKAAQVEATGEPADVPEAPKVTAQRAVRASSVEAAPAPRKTVAAQPAPKAKERSISSSLTNAKTERSSSVSRKRKKAHQSSSWGISFLFKGLRDAIVSSRVQYLPLLGAAPVRFGSLPEFDRVRIANLSDFETRMAEIAAAKEKAAQEKAAREAEAAAAQNAPGKTVSPAAQAEQSVAQVKRSDAGTSVTPEQNGQNSASANVIGGTVTQNGEAISARNTPRSVVTGTASSGNIDYVPVNSEIVMKYFDGSEAGPSVKVGVPFVMPYQSEQPLIMDSRANYSQTDAGTQNGASSK